MKKITSIMIPYPEDEKRIIKMMSSGKPFIAPPPMAVIDIEDSLTSYDEIRIKNIIKELMVGIKFGILTSDQLTKIEKTLDIQPSKDVSEEDYDDEDEEDDE